VSRAWIIVFDLLIGSGRLDQMKHRLKFAYDRHIEVNSLQVVSCEVIVGYLIAYRFLVLIDGYVIKSDFTGFSDLLRVYEIFFWHINYK
jgi:hypothetical protein